MPLFIRTTFPQFTFDGWVGAKHEVFLSGQLAKAAYIAIACSTLQALLCGAFYIKAFVYYMRCVICPVLH